MQPVFFEYLEEMVDHCDVYVEFNELGGNSYIIHVVLSAFPSPSLVPGFKYCVHEPLEGSWGVAHSKEHHFAFEQPSARFKGHFPLVIVTDSDVVVAPSYIKLAEQFVSLQVFYTLGKVGQWGDVFPCDCI